MKKVLLTGLTVASLAFAGISAAATTHAIGKTWYTGFGFNWNATRGQEVHETLVNINSSTAMPGLTYKLDSTQIGWNVFLGKQVTHHIALEGGFVYLGDEKYRIKPVINKAGKFTGKLAARNIYNVYLDALFSVPVWQSGYHKISTYAKFGGVYMHLRNKAYYLLCGGCCPPDPVYTVSYDHSWTLDNFGADYGFGMQYKYKDYAVRISYNGYKFRKETQKTHVIPNTVNVDLQWYFD